MPRSKNVWSYTSTPPIRLHGMVLRVQYIYFVINSEMLQRERQLGSIAFQHFFDWWGDKTTNTVFIA
jgi:hypothetical protein